ncbi:MAG: FtsQ-type POTRA domain-containing protein [bacterium]|nr:FtsQ-type POTRA domain-containing protein [bacterium]MDE0217153.1 FtsQ-type POTRA domain-containing protein [bacterium]
MISDEPPQNPHEDQPESALPQVDPRIQARRVGVRSRRRIRAWISIGAIAVSAAGAFGVTQSPLMDVDDVEVIGAPRTGADRVLEAAGIEVGSPLLGLDLSGPRRSIAALPWVDEVRSSRTWGGNVTFDVTERKAVAQIPVDGGWALADGQGRVLEVTPTPWDLPVVLFGPVPRPGGWLRYSALPLLDASEALMPLQGHGIESISLVSGQVVVDLPGGGEAYWGGGDDPRGKAIALATMLAEMVDADCLEELEKIDLSVPEFPSLTPKDACS